jgi:hypothetical protein
VIFFIPAAVFYRPSADGASQQPAPAKTPSIKLINKTIGRSSGSAEKRQWNSPHSGSEPIALQ